MEEKINNPIQEEYTKLYREIQSSNDIGDEKITLKMLQDSMKELPEFQGIEVEDILEQSVKIDLKGFIEIIVNSLKMKNPNDEEISKSTESEYMKIFETVISKYMWIYLVKTPVNLIQFFTHEILWHTELNSLEMIFQ